MHLTLTKHEIFDFLADAFAEGIETGRRAAFSLFPQIEDEALQLFAGIVIIELFTLYDDENLFDLLGLSAPPASIGYTRSPDPQQRVATCSRPSID
jgi:hypothetical protein